MIWPVAPRAGAWIETALRSKQALAMVMSRPVRARGLKQASRRLMKRDEESRPVRARGLKQSTYEAGIEGTGVAPRAGAWIET